MVIQLLILLREYLNWRRIFSSAESLPKINNGLELQLYQLQRCYDRCKCKKTENWWRNNLQVFNVKIGKINISIPEKVKVVLSGNIVIEGPFGKNFINWYRKLWFKDWWWKKYFNKTKKTDQNSKRMWGINRSLPITIIGAERDEKILELVGVGYRATIKGSQLNLQLVSVMI